MFPSSLMFVFFHTGCFLYRLIFVFSWIGHFLFSLLSVTMSWPIERPIGDIGRKCTELWRWRSHSCRLRPKEWSVNPSMSFYFFLNRRYILDLFSNSIGISEHIIGIPTSLVHMSCLFAFPGGWDRISKSFATQKIRFLYFFKYRVSYILFIN